MANQITTTLKLSSGIATLHWGNHVFGKKNQKKLTEAIQRQLKEAERLYQKRYGRIGQVTRLDGVDVQFADGVVIKTNYCYEKALKKVKEGVSDMHGQKASTVPDPKSQFEGTTLGFMGGAHPLDKIKFGDHISERVFASKQELAESVVKRWCQEEGIEYNLQNKKVYETLAGVYQSIVPRQHLKANFKDGRSAQVVYAWNSPLKGLKYLDENGNEQTVDHSICSPYIRYPMNPEVAMLRGLQEKDAEGRDLGYVGFFGRVDASGNGKDKLCKAKSAVKFIFNALLNSTLEDRAKLHIQGSSARLSIAIQALLNMHGEQCTMLREEIEAFEELVKLSKNGSLHIQGTDGVDYTVTLEEIPIAENQFNVSNRLEAIVPRWWSGEKRARDQSNKADDILIARAEATEKTHPHYQLIQHTKELLRECRTGKYRTVDELMIRTFLCDLLGIVTLNHCKSSVDRAGLMMSIKHGIHRYWQVAQKTGKDLSRLSIYKIRDTQDRLFRKSVAEILPLAIKNAEFARGAPDLKYYIGLWQHASLQYILTDDFFQKKKLRTRIMEVPIVLVCGLVWCLELIGSLIASSVFLEKDILLSHWRHKRDVLDWITRKEVNPDMLPVADGD